MDARIGDGAFFGAEREKDSQPRRDMVAPTLVSLRAAHVAGDLDLDGSVLDGEFNAALLSLKDPVYTAGVFALDLRRAQVDHDLLLRWGAPPTGGVDLSDAHVGRLLDDSRTWIPPIRVRGLVYSGILAGPQEEGTRAAIEDRGEHAALDPPGDPASGQSDSAAQRASWFRPRSHRPADVSCRLAWIRLAEEDEDATVQQGSSQHGAAAARRRLDVVRRRILRRPNAEERIEAAIQALPDPAAAAEAISLVARVRAELIKRGIKGPPGYTAQPYTQLIAFLRQEGRDDDARLVAFERERRRRRESGVATRAWGLFLRVTVGYGFKPLRALGLLVLLIALGAPMFEALHDRGELVVAAGNEAPSFNAVLYAIDRLIPVVSLGFRDAFVASGWAQWASSAYALIGWALMVAVLAGLTAAVRRT